MVILPPHFVPLSRGFPQNLQTYTTFSMPMMFSKSFGMFAQTHGRSAPRTTLQHWEDGSFWGPGFKTNSSQTDPNLWIAPLHTWACAQWPQQRMTNAVTIAKAKELVLDLPISLLKLSLSPSLCILSRLWFVRRRGWLVYIESLWGPGKAVFI